MSEDQTPYTTETVHPVRQNNGAVTTLAIILVVMLLIIAGLVFMNFASNGNADSDAARQLRQQIAEKENELRAKGIQVPADTTSVEELSRRISRDANALKSSIGALQQTLSDKEATLNKLRTDYEAVKTINERNGAEATQLRTQIATLRSQQGDLPYLQQQVKSLNASLLEKEQQLAEYLNRPSADQLVKLRKSLSDALLKNQQLTNEIANLKASTNTMVSESEVTKIKNQLQRLIPENENLRLLVQKLRAERDFEKLYVESADQLSPSASKLFAELKTLEGQSADQLKAAYTRIGEQLNAHIVQDVNFASGSATVSFADRATIEDKLKATPPSSTFLVVGYASETGGEQGNQTLSANRAATTASVVNQLLKNGQKVRAVYLGQTDRFSPAPDKNQICEIWEIKK